MPSCLLTLNAGSSSLKYAVFAIEAGLPRLASGKVAQIGTQDLDDVLNQAIPSDPSHSLVAVGHRIVHGGTRYTDPVQIDAGMIAELRKLTPLAPEHLPAQLGFLEAARSRFPDVPHIACFDTAFHRDLPRVARLLPIPRRYEQAGIRRYGFHGLSYEFLMGELARVAGAAAADGRVILAHLGNGASLAAVHRGRCIDTSMGLTPAAGIPMSTRSGDLDPGLAAYLAASERMSPDEFNTMVNHRSGLLGLSGSSGDMRELLQRETGEPHAAEAVAVFCYQARKWIGAYAAALGGLNTLVFSGGIGENRPAIRERICAGLEFLGLHVEPGRNAQNAPLISPEGDGVAVRVIRTDEELIIARSICRLLGPPFTE